METIALGQPTFDDEELVAVQEVLASGWVAGQGPATRLLEDRLRDLTGAGHAIAVNNCTAALHLAMLVHDVGPGDEVLVADYTYPATGHSVMYVGATPRFVDVRRDTGTISVDAACDAIGPRTRGIIAVDVFGQCADYDELRELAVEHGLFLVEDAAAATGATYRGRPAGSLADVACFSFHGRKGVTCGEGGAFVTDDARLAERARRLSCFGVESALSRQQSTDLAVPVFETLGYNYKLSDIAAAIQAVQLDRLPGLAKARRAVADHYRELIGDLDGVVLPVALDDREHMWQTYAVTLDDSVDRGRIASQLRDAGIQANFGTYASHLQPLYATADRCPTSARLFQRQLALPMHANLVSGQVARVAAGLAAALHAS